MKNKILKYVFFISVILLLLIGVAIAQIKIKANVSGFKLGKASDIYSRIEQGGLNVDDLMFLDEQGNKIGVESVRKKQYKNKIYDVDVENDIVLVSRNDGTLVWSGNSNNGTAVGDAHQVDAGYLGKGFEFDGDGDYVEVFGDGISAPEFEFMKELSISGWFRLNQKASDKNSVEHIIQKFRPAGSPGNDGWRLYISSDDDKAYFCVYNGTYDWPNTDPCAISTTAFNIVGEWHHVGATFVNSTGNLTIYVNGIAEHSVQDLSYFLKGEDYYGMHIGKDDVAGGYFNGTIDDVLIFNRSLSAEEIRGLYANTSSKYVGAEFTGLSEGSQSFTSYVQDEGGNVNSSVLSFDVDLTYPSINFTYPTPANNTNQSDTYIFVNVSAADSANNISTFIDFDDSLVGWWRMDDTNQSVGTYGAKVYDKSGHCYDNETEILILSEVECSELEINEEDNYINEHRNLIEEECKGRVAQRIEHLSHSEEDAGSNFTRESRRAHTNLCRNESNESNNKERKQAYSLDKAPFSLRGILHKFNLSSEIAETHTLSDNKQEKYINFSLSDDDFDVVIENNKCYIPKWKYFYELDKTEKVATLNQETKELEWQLPLEYQEFEHDDDMYRILLEDGSELLVSEKHKVYADYKRDGTFESFALKPIKEVYEKFEQGKEIYFLNEDDEVIKVKLITKEPYSGKIYDVDVPNDIILVRRKDKNKIYDAELLEDEYDNQDVYYIVEFNNTADDILPITGSGRDNNAGILLFALFALLFVLAKRNVSRAVLDNKIIREKRGGVR